MYLHSLRDFFFVLNFYMGPYHQLWAVSHYMPYSEILQTLVYDWQCHLLSAT